MPEKPFNETYISVDVETAGSIPGMYPLLSIGACLVGNTEKNFYVELKPDRDEFLAEAQAIHGLSMERLKQTGLEAGEALHRFEDWLGVVVPAGTKPVFVAFNAVFDWMFINDYFLRYMKRNPFGHTALDIKSFYMGLAGCTWQETTMAHISPQYLTQAPLSHHALQDAIDQARIFERLLDQASHKKKGVS
jgi:DNA polymerase III epsilon subunit-like protein